VITRAILTVTTFALVAGCGGGVAFELVRKKGGTWTEKVLHAFGAAKNSGTVYEISPARGGKWSERILYSFTGGSDGQYPSGTLTRDSLGNLYGTTSNGGRTGNGVVFEITH
jgi:hypothetical protein